MLSEAIERYIGVRRAAGYDFCGGARLLHHYARFAVARGDSHVRRETALEWAAAAISPHARGVRLRTLVGFARFQHAEDERHEIPPRNAFAVLGRRPLPYIFSDSEIARLLVAADELRLSYRYPLRRETYRTMIGLIAATGLRRSDALNLRVQDLSPDGVIIIRRTTFRKSRLVPLHPTTEAALRRYIKIRESSLVADDHLFLSASGGRIESSVVNQTFRRMLTLAKIKPTRDRSPRIHDLRHTFATRALERCPGDRRVIAKHFVALSTYMGHVKMSATHWYLEATPELMTDIARAAESTARKAHR